MGVRAPFCERWQFDDDDIDESERTDKGSFFRVAYTNRRYTVLEVRSGHDEDGDAGVDDGIERT